MIRIWHSYACNNSTSFRLIARFSDPLTTRETAAELAEFFAAQAVGGAYEDIGLTTLARTYGFEWEDEGMGAGGPEVYTEGTTLIVYMPYGLGFGPGVPAYLADRGGIPEEETTAMPEISLLMRGERTPALDAQLDDAMREGAWGSPCGRFVAHDVAVFRDAHITGLCFVLEPSQLPGLHGWLADHGLERVVLEVEAPRTRHLFRTLDVARCTACEGPLEYLDPRLDDIETPQLVCRPCGGFYDLAAFEKP